MDRGNYHLSVTDDELQLLTLPPALHAIPGQGTERHPHSCVRLQLGKAQLTEATDFSNISKYPQPDQSPAKTKCKKI